MLYVYCYGLNCITPKKGNIEVLIPNTSESDLIWRQSLYSDNQVTTTSSE